MTKRAEAKYKIDRRMGENIWGRPKTPVNKREYGPGQHGQRRKGKLSDFGTAAARQAEAEGLLRQHLREAVPQASTTRPSAARATPRENLIGLLERRLDAVVYRAKFVPTLFAARQFVNHGHVAVNGKRVNIACYRVQGRRRGRGARKPRKQLAIVLEALAARRARRARLHRGRPQQDDRQVRRASPASPTCPTRCRWSRTWSSSSTRADRFSLVQVRPRPLETAAFFMRRPGA